MKVKLSDYKTSKKAVLDMYEKHGMQRVLEMCCYTFIPIIVAYKFVNEKHGGFEKEMQRIIDFYGYTEIE